MLHRVDAVTADIATVQARIDAQASTQRFYDRPGLAFVPVGGLPPSPVAIAWRNDVEAQPVRDFVDTARMLASLDLVPSSTPAVGTPLSTTIAAVARRRQAGWCSRH